MERGLRSLSNTFKARKLVFQNPVRGMTFTQVNWNIPTPLGTALIREKLNSLNPVIALAVTPVAFHVLTAKQVSELLLTNIIDWPLHLYPARRSRPRTSLPMAQLQAGPVAEVAEVHASCGDARRISVLFRLSVESTNRYIGTLEYLDLTAGHAHTRPGPSLGSPASAG